jgi:DNA topoisomerase-3
MKVYIKVAFSEKDEVKQLGARWDKDMKSWYIPEDADKAPFSKWATHDPSTVVQNDSNATKIHLNVPFADKDAVKAAGGRWDGDRKQWYYLSDKDASAFSKWADNQSSPSQSQPKTPVKYQPSKNNESFSDEMDDILSLGDN